MSGRKTDKVGIVGVRTDQPNALDSWPPDYKHVAILSTIKQFMLEDLLELQQKAVASVTNDGDIIHGIKTAVDMIIGHCKKLKYKRMIMVVTNATGRMSFESDLIRPLVALLQDQDIVLKVLVIDWMNDEGGQFEADASTRMSNVSGFKHAFSTLDTDRFVLASYEEAADSLSVPKIRKVRPVKTFKGNLILGDPNKYGPDRTVSIPVEGYPCTRKATVPVSTAYAVTESEEERRAVHYVRDYYVENKDEPDGKAAVDKESLESGYKYGSEIVTFSEEQKALIKGPTSDAELSIIGFTAQRLVPRWYLMSPADYIVANANAVDAAIALSSLAHALVETESYGFARYVSKENADPQVVLLAPKIEPEFEALVLCQLPFAEDYRQYQFPSLGDVKSKAGISLPADSLQRKSREPTAEMNSYMEHIINHMDLMTAEMDEDADPIESVVPEDVYNPLLHRIRHVIKECAIQGDTALIPAIQPILLKYSKPDEILVDECQAELDSLEKLFNIKVVERKMTIRQQKEVEEQRGKWKAKETELDIDALLGDSP
jgi:ATP-dependent DNA helicase 2 subunit 2